jgi:hypothetical protein
MSIEAAELSEGTRLLRERSKLKRFASFGPDWVSTDEACRILCVTKSAFVRAFPFRACIEGRMASDTSMTAAGCGRLHRRLDCVRVASIRKRARLTLAAACRVYSAIKAGGPL